MKTVNTNLNNAIIKALQIQNMQDECNYTHDPVQVAKIISSWFSNQEYYNDHNTSDSLTKYDDLVGLGLVDGVICAIMSHGIYSSNRMSIKHGTKDLRLTRVAIRTVNGQYLDPEDRALSHVEKWVKLTGGMVICTKEEL